MSFCPHCKTDEGPHFVPPCFGEPGFFLCGTPEDIFLQQKEAYLDRFQSYAKGSIRYEDAKLWLIENNVPLPEEGVMCE